MINWPDFVKNEWEKRPTVLRGGLRAPIASEEELLELLQRASAHAREGCDKHVSFYVGAERSRDLDKHLPGPLDTSVAGYHQRIEALLGGAEFCLIVERAQLYHAKVWTRVCDFLSDLYRELGVPGKVETTLLLGTYRKTPIGVHKDVSDVIQFQLLGKKRLVTWPDEALRDETFEPLDYERFLPRSVALAPTLKDVIYSPASYFHIGESDGGLSASLSVLMLNNLLKRRLPAKGGEPARTQHG